MMYSNLINQRLSESSNFEKISINKSILDIKPKLWFGSANAWLVLLGSSPGNSDPNGKAAEDYASEISFMGMSCHLNYFDDKRHFWEKIRKYIKYIMPEYSDNIGYRGTLVGNLTNSFQGDSKKLDKNELLKGALDTFRLLNIVKPKLVICLQKSVYVLINEMILENGHQKAKNELIIKVDSGIKSKITYSVPVQFISSSDSLWGKWVLTRMPVHPSRSNFCLDENLKEQFFSKMLPLTNEYLLS